MKKTALWMGLLLSTLFVPTNWVRADSAEAWGVNADGELGNGSSGGVSRSPVAVTGMTSGVSAVAAGGLHSLAIHNGALFAWGYNYNGQLGNSATLTNSTTPIAVAGMTSGVTAIAGGGYHSLSILNGAVFAWGYNSSGQLGSGSSSGYSDVPVAVIGMTSGVTAIAAGNAHSLAIENGAAESWGSNSSGQLGNGTTTDSFIPVTVSGLASGVTAIAAGGAHNLAIQNGAAKAWGANSGGQLGNGLTTSSNTPVSVTALSSGVTAIAAGGNHSLAIRNGNVYSWGYNADGELGNGSTSNRTTPVLALDTSADLIAIAAGSDTSYALSSDGSLWVWGANQYGQLGLGTSVASYNTPQHLLAPSGYVFTGIDADANAYDDHAIATLAVVPEPSSLMLPAMSGVGLLYRRRSSGTAVNDV